MKSPFDNVDLPWEPQLSYLLVGLDVCDHGEEVRENIRKYNPNSRHGRRELIKEVVLPGLGYLSYRHRFALYKLLEKSLSDSGYDFSTLFEADYDNYSAVAWDETEIVDPRGFFEDIYRIAATQWKEDLQKAGFEDQSTW
ncbi:hypothetical protein [Pseudomonas sp. Root562]|uniref:hypothetical protein n=1 Tax=Pseudomonas sp. Root562 TaxID=1736561 RepID=UPI001F42D56C|nr:hypothetical protein [Pseudomonas sp. Root562]